MTYRCCETGSTGSASDVQWTSNSARQSIPPLSCRSSPACHFERSEKSHALDPDAGDEAQATRTWMLAQGRPDGMLARSGRANRGSVTIGDRIRRAVRVGMPESLARFVVTSVVTSRKLSAAVLVSLLLGAVLLGGAACGDVPREPTMAASSQTATVPTQTASPTLEPTPTATPIPEPTATLTPTPAPAPPTTPDPRPAEYLLVAGDTILAIAKRFGVSIECLAEANQSKASNVMSHHDGTLRIPSPDECAPDGPATPPLTSTTPSG